MITSPDKEASSSDRPREADIQQTLEMLQSIIDQSHYLIYVKDLEGRFLLASKSLARFFGQAVEELLGKTSHDFLPLETADQHRANDLRVMEQGSILRAEETVMLADGLHYYYTTKFPLCNSEGVIYAVCGTSVDVTQIKKSEALLRESECKQRALLAAIPDMIFVFDRQGTCREWEAAANSPPFMAGESLIGRRLPQVLTESLSTRAMDSIVKALDSGQVQNFVYSLKNSQERHWFEARIAPMGDNRAICVSRDITNTRRVEEELRQSQQKLDTILQTMIDGVVTFDKNSRITYINPAAEKILNIDSSILGSNCWDNPWIQLDGSGRQYPPGKNPLSRVIKERTVLRNLELQIVRTGKENKWLSINAAPLLGENGEARGGIVSFQDISDRKRIEKELHNIQASLERLVRQRTMALEASNRELLHHRQRLEAEIIERERAEMAMEIAKNEAERANEAKSRFLANISHELRTPLNAVIGFSELLKGSVSPADARRYISAINTSGKSLLAIINDILDLSMIEADTMPFASSLINLPRLLREVAEVFRLEADNKKLSLSVEIEPGLPEALWLDESRVRQVLVNLAGNAIKYTEEGGVVVAAGFVPVQDARQAAVDLRITVSDTGIGIAREYHSRLFDLFFQVDGQRRGIKGTGLGLPITRQLVDKMNGEILVASEPGEGSVFTVILRDVAVGRTLATSSGMESLDWKDITFKPAKVLVVDDVESSRLLVSEVLSSQGLEVLEADNGTRALEAIEEHHPDLIIADIHMPGMNGVELAAIIKNRSDTAGIPIIALTALPNGASEGASASSLFDSYLTKPAVLNQLTEQVMRYLPPAHPQLPALPGMSGYMPVLEQPLEPEGIEDAPILVVDDNELNLVLARAQLNLLGFDADTCASGRECLERIRDRSYSLVLMDYYMQDMNGLEAARSIREIKAGWGNPASIPIVAMSAVPDTVIEDNIASGGFAGWLTKPFTSEQLRQVLSQHLEPTMINSLHD